jgi:hypothetical protein
VGVACCSNHFEVKAVGSIDIYHFDLRVADDLPPVGSEMLKTNATLRFLCAGRDIISADNQSRTDFALVKAVVDLPVGTAVDQSHPAHADHADANDAFQVSYLVCKPSPIGLAWADS